jgi:hypothetical protein
MVFASAWGGGIRAAVWTAYVVDCAFENHDDPRPWGSTGDEACRAVDEASEYGGDFLFPTGSAIELMIGGSGISGGSLGLAEYIAFLVEPEAGEAHDWVKVRLSDDYLSPALARLFFVDMPVSFAAAGLDFIDDRADILQQGWELSWDQQRREGVGMRRGIRDTWEALDLAPSLPLVVMNSASMNDGCSINGSHVGLAVESEGADECRSLIEFDSDRTDNATGDRFARRVVGTHDVVDFLCTDEDLSLAATALMSARFPAISPSGRLAPGVRCGIDRAAIYATDGGQLELSGTLTAVQLWEALEPQIIAHNLSDADYCIVPVLIHMENGFNPDEAGSSDSIPNEWLDPLIFSFTSAKGGLVSNARQRAALEFAEPLVGVTVKDGANKEVPRFAYVRTRAHPGASAPLGWTLSEATLDDLAAQLGQNGSQFELINRWLTEPLFCVEPQGTG